MTKNQVICIYKVLCASVILSIRQTIKKYNKKWHGFACILTRVKWWGLNSNSGGCDCPKLFSDDFFLHKKEVWISKTSWLFLIIMKFQKSKKNFTGILGDLEGAGPINSFPHSSNTQILLLVPNFKVKGPLWNGS